MEKRFADEGKRSSMTDQKVTLLEEVGFTWAKRKGDFSWESKFDELVKYKRSHGGLDPPTKNSAAPALGRWVSTQRSQYKLYETGQRSRMTAERVMRLNRVGFSWKMMGDRKSGDDELSRADV